MKSGSLWENRNILKSQLEKLMLMDEDIIGVFYGGSISKNNEDLYSDIDLRILISEGISFEKKLHQWINKFSNILFIETLSANYAVIHFSNFIKLDLFVYDKSTLIPSVWLKDILIYKDTEDKALNRIKKLSNELSYDFSQEEFDFMLHKYYANLHEVVRRVNRKERNYAEGSMLMMKHILTSLWYISRYEIPNSLGDWSKYEGSRSKLNSREIAFLQKYTPVKLNAVSTFIDEINKEFLTVAEKVSQVYSFDFNRDTFTEVNAFIHWESDD